MMDHHDSHQAGGKETKWNEMNKPFTSIPWPIKIVHVQSPIISQQELTKRSNNGLRDMTCVSIYIYIYFRKQSGQPICLRLSLQLRLWLLRLLVEVLLPFIRLTCVLCLTPLRLKIKKRQDPWKCTTSLIIFWVNHISIIFHIFHQFMEIELPKTKTDSQTQRHANTCHEQEI